MAAPPERRRAPRRAAPPPRGRAGTCDILVKGCARDARWLPWLFRSIARFATGFREVVVLFPRAERAAIDGMGLTRERVIFTDDHGDGYLYQQVCKLQADRYTDADFVCHVDSDCIFQGPASPETYFTEGRPQLLHVSYAALGGEGAACWRAGTERALGRPVELEFMRRMPLVYPRAAYAGFRGFLERTHGTPLEPFLMGSPPDARPSEFNWLGAWCWFHMHDGFHWVDTLSEPLPPNPLRQYWSHSFLDDREMARLDELLAGEGGAGLDPPGQGGRP